MNNIAYKKEEAAKWFRSLRDLFCRSFEEIDGGKFNKKNGTTKEKEVEK